VLFSFFINVVRPGSRLQLGEVGGGGGEKEEGGANINIDD